MHTEFFKTKFINNNWRQRNKQSSDKFTKLYIWVDIGALSNKHAGLKKQTLIILLFLLNLQMTIWA